MTQTLGAEVLASTQPEIFKSPGNEFYGVRFEAEPYIGERNQSFGLTRTKDENGFNFAVRVSSDAKGVDFCAPNPLDKSDNGLRWSLEPIEETADGAVIYGGFIRGLQPGDLYGIRVERDNPTSYDNLLIDPYTRGITRLGQPDHPDSQAYSVVLEENPKREIKRPKIKPSERVIYEAHITDSTKLNPDIPEELRGTYLGFAHPANIEKLKALGVTTVELLPIMQFFSEKGLANIGKVNHWGYNTAGFFAPHEGYAYSTEPGAANEEVKYMVDALHDAGIEVVLDVVYNHSADGEPDDTAVSLKGLDEAGYYHDTYIDPKDGRKKYHGHSGVGNTINTSSPASLQLTLDSMRYWHNVIGVDGFRLDLAASLVRDRHLNLDVKNSKFVRSIKADKDLSDCMIITEPWDLGGYPEGQFAHVGMPEWNGKYRDFVRAFWLRDNDSIGALATMLAGSYDSKGTINFITAHDGFTVRDLTEYDHKHNEANGENNEDGHNDNRSNSHGVEGPTDDPEIIWRRQRAVRNLFLTLLMARGTPMILDGDPTLHTQQGNNNPYCQDNEINWRNHDLRPDQEAMRDFVAGLIAIRKQSSLGDHSATMGKIHDSPTGEHGVEWFNLWGNHMQQHDWHSEDKVFGMYSSGLAGEPSDSIITYFNRTNKDIEVTLPQEPSVRGAYALLADTDSGEIDLTGIRRIDTDKGKIIIKAMSAMALKRVPSWVSSSGRVANITFTDISQGATLDNDGLHFAKVMTSNERPLPLAA